MERYSNKFTWPVADAATANGNSAALDWPGGSGTFVVYGTFDSGTVKLQASFDGGTTYIDVEDASFTANGAINVQIAACKVRANVAGAGGSVNVKAAVPGLPDPRG